MSKSKKALIIAINLLGYPLLLILIAVNLKHIISQGKSYGIYVYAGFILTAVFALLYYLIMFHMAKRKKKSPIKQGIVLAMVAMLSLSGLWIVIENLAPNKLLSATSGTIYMEDLMEDYNTRADVNKTLLDDFIYINTYGNDNLVYLNTKKSEDDSNKLIFQLEKSNEKIELRNDLLTLLKEERYDEYNEALVNWNLARKKAYDKYRQEGYKSEQIKLLEAKTFASINDDGYVTFKGPWIDMANGGRLTIPALIHLLLDHRDLAGRELPSVRDGKLATGKVKWGILDMMGPPIGISTMDFKDVLKAEKENLKRNNQLTEEKEKELNERIQKAQYANVRKVPAMAMPLEVLGEPALKDLIIGDKENMELSGVATDLISIVQKVIMHENVTGAPIYIGIDTERGELHLVSSNVSRGTLGYQNAAWFNANALTFMLSSVFSIRKFFLIFSGIIGLISIATGVLKQGKLHCEEEFELRMKEIEEEEIIYDEISDDEFLSEPINQEETSIEDGSKIVVDEENNDYQEIQLENLENTEEVEEESQ